MRRAACGESEQSAHWCTDCLCCQPDTRSNSTHSHPCARAQSPLLFAASLRFLLFSFRFLMETYPPRTLEQVQAQRQKQQRALAAKNNTNQAAAKPANAPAAAKKNGKAAERADGRALTQMRATCQPTHRERDAKKDRDAWIPSFTHFLSRSVCWFVSSVLQVGLITAAAGSAYVERQGTKVICAMSVGK